MHHGPEWQGMCLTLLQMIPLHGQGNQIFFLLLLLPSFIPGNTGSYYPSWNDFSRDPAIPRELSLPAATQSIANWTALWFIENLLLWKNSHLTHTFTHTHTLGILLQKRLMWRVSGRRSSRQRASLGQTRCKRFSTVGKSVVTNIGTRKVTSFK